MITKRMVRDREGREKGSGIKSTILHQVQTLKPCKYPPPVYFNVKLHMWFVVIESTAFCYQIQVHVTP